MNTDTGHLVAFDNLSPHEIKNLFANGYQPVPDGFRAEARRRLKGQQEAYVARGSSTPLGKWAAQERKKKKKAKRKAEKAARKRSRR